MPILVDNLLENDDLSQLGKPYAEAKVDVMNPEKRLPVLMLIDTSNSIHPYEGLLKKAIEGVYDSILNDRKAKNVTELGVMAFNSEIQILEKVREIRKHKEKGRNLDFVCEGATLTGLALKAALAHLEARKEAYKKTRPVTRYYAPVLLFISGSKPECFDAVVKPQEEKARQYCIDYIKNQVAVNRLVVISVEVGDYCDHDMMVKITGLPDDRHVIQLREPETFAKFKGILISLMFGARRFDDQSLNDFNFNQGISF